MVLQNDSPKSRPLNARNARVNAASGQSARNDTRRDVYLKSAPKGLEKEFHALLTPEAIDFLTDLVLEFDDRVDELYYARLCTKYEIKKSHRTPKFLVTDSVKEEWKVAPVGKRLLNRHLDLGDVTPTNYDHFVAALRASVQGIQVDFDDAHCPTWRNHLTGLHNVYRAVRDELQDVPTISEAPVLIIRPRAWNMLEHNMTVNGKEVPGPLFDFGLLMFHTGKILTGCESGPFFYLSKMEAASEARLWNDMFVWAQSRLGIPRGTVKACVLIENILSSFQMDQILYELRDHSLGLNCGVWDYTASIISTFGNDRSFLLPDRNKYVNMGRPFLKSYMELVVRTCHRRGAHATSGMSAVLLPDESDTEEYRRVIDGVTQGKLAEIGAGVDGFLVYDVGLVPSMNRLWKEHGGPFANQINHPGTARKITEADLLTLPSGMVTLQGLKHNISVAVLFNLNWLNGKGHFAFKGAVEDSATAEISTFQIWQWIRHGVTLEEDGRTVTRAIVSRHSMEIVQDLLKEYGTSRDSIGNVLTAYELFMEIVSRRDLPDFITTYLSNNLVFRRIHARL